LIEFINKTYCCI